MGYEENQQKPAGWVPGGTDRRGSVLVYVLLMILLTSIALVLFLERAHRELRTEALFYQRDELRVDAYNIFDTMLAVLEDVVEIDGALRDPSQGWANPLEYAEIGLPEGMRVNFDFRDQTGLISLATVEPDLFERLLEHLEFDLARREDLTDAFFLWVREDYTPRGMGVGRQVYETRELVHRVRGRPIRSYRELFAIEGFAEAFLDEEGLPNERYEQFRALTTIAATNRINVNSVRPEILRIVLDDLEGATIMSDDDIREGRPLERPWFNNVGEAAGLWGIGLPGNRFSAEIEVLEATIRLSRGDETLHLRVELSREAPPGENGQANGDDPRQVGPFFILRFWEE